MEESVLGRRIEKERLATPEGEAEYRMLADKANRIRGLRIEDKGEYYEVVKYSPIAFPETLRGLSQERQREELYKELRNRVSGNSLENGLAPDYISETHLSADECRAKYVNYIGDEDVKADWFLMESKKIKDYIRGLALYKERTDGDID